MPWPVTLCDDLLITGVSFHIFASTPRCYVITTYTLGYFYHFVTSCALHGNVSLVLGPLLPPVRRMVALR